MPTRATNIQFRADVENYLANVRAAGRATAEFAETSATRLAQQKDAYDIVGRSALAVGAVAAAGVALAVAKFAEFDATMSNVKAATQETAANMDLLRAAALAAGADSAFTATEAANAIEELGKAGLNTQEILSGGLNGALALASAGNIGVADAAQIAAIAVKQFNLEGGDVPHVADLMAAGAGKAVGSVGDLAAALGQAGLVANGAGQNIEDTVGVLAALADASLLGSDAGTSLKASIIALQAPTAKSQAVMDEYNLSFYDGNEKMLSFTEIAGQLQTQLAGLGDETRNAALNQIFGTDAIRVANVLYEEGADGIARYVDQTNETGYAAKVAADRLDNLKGDVEKLGGAFDTALIQQGSGANDSLRLMVQTATGLVDAFGDLPGPVLAVAAAVGLAGGAALIAIPKYAAFRTALDDLHISGRRAAVGIGLAGGAVAVAGVAFAYFAGLQAKATANTQEFKDSLDQATGAATDYTRELVAKKLAETGAYDAALEAGVSQKQLTDAVLEGGEALETVRGKLSANNTVLTFFNSNTTGMAIAAGNANYEIGSLSRSLEDGRKQLENTKAASEETEGGLGAVAAAAKAAQKSVQDLAAELRGFGDTQLNVNDATRQVEQSLDDLTAKLAENGATLDVGTEAGRENGEAVDAIARSYRELAASTIENTGVAADSIPVIQAGRDAVIASRVAAGEAQLAAEQYADSLGLIPGDIATRIKADTAQATRDIDNFIDGQSGRTIYLTALTSYAYDSGSVGTIPQPKVGRARGGILPGAPSAVDNMRIAAASGEFVVNAAATERNRSVLEALNAGVQPQYVASQVQYAPAGVQQAPLAPSGPVTAYMDPGLQADIRALARAHRATLDEVGLSTAAQTGSARRASLGE